jgi:hypothetical protein
VTATIQKDLIKRLRTLAIRQRMSLGVMHSAAPADFALLMAAAAHAFVPGRAYARGTPGPAIDAAVRALAGQDLAALVRDARDAEAARRDARRAQWAHRQESPG